MNKPKNVLKVAAACLLGIGMQPECPAQTAFPAAGAVSISAASRAEMQTQLAKLKSQVADLKKSDVDTRLKLSTAAGGLLPGVYFLKGADEWYGLSYEESREFPSNRDLRKRHNL